MCFGSSGSSQPTSSTVYQQSLPPELAPYAKQLLGMTCAYIKATPTYQSGIGCAAAGGQGIQGTTVAGFSPMQQQAMTGMQQMGVAPQLDQATGLANLGAGEANSGAGEANYVASNYNPINATNQYTPAQLAQMNVNAPSLSQYQMQGPQSYTGANVSQYMNPYLQTTQNQAIQNYANQLPQLGSAATQAGGLGGSREALMQAQAQQGLQQTLAGNVANAYGNAQQQFNTQNQLQQGANTQNLQALLGIQQLGAGQNLQAQQLNQAQIQALNQLGVQQAANTAQYGQAAQQANIGQQQFGAGLGMQAAGLQETAAGLQETAAGQLGNLGTNQYNQQMGILQGQNQMGGQQQNLTQNVYNNLQTAFRNAQNWTPAQLSLFSGLLHGSSPGALGGQSGTTTQYLSAPSGAAQLTAAGVGAAGLSQLANAMGGKRGGKVHTAKHNMGSSGIGHLMGQL